MPAAESQLLVISALAEDPVVDCLRRSYTPTTWLLANLCHAQVTVDTGDASALDRILIEGHSLPVENLQAILVSGMACNAGLGHSRDDSRYIEHETFASWMALLQKATCRVLNRPSFESLPPGLPPVQVRAVSRKAGIPTIADEIRIGAELLNWRARGRDVACVDLYTQSSFWLRGNYDIDEQRLYSATSLPAAGEQMLIAYVGGRCQAGRASYTGNSSAPLQDGVGPIHDEAASATRHLAALLRMDYAYFAFANRNGHAEFCRAYPYWPGSYTDNPTNSLVTWASSAVLAELTAA